ncbi:MAG: rubrerythrin [Myxococcales bacterium]|nr:MAG: rubrerythrin [Myxococcales bacterium]
MTKDAVVLDLLDFAIEEEEAAAEFYTRLAKLQKKDWMRKVLEGFAKEEAGHKAKLLDIKQNNKFFAPTAERVTDLKIADYTVDVELSENLDFQQALIIAMKKEKSAFRLYSDLAEVADTPELRQTFLALAQEEAKHKLRFEVEYDEAILNEN